MGRLGPPRPLAADDDREAFDCGRASLNDWLQRHAWRNQRDGTSRTTVVCDSESGRIAGFIALSTGQIEREWLSRTQQRNKPDPVPVMLLGQLAVDTGYQSLGVGRSLLRLAVNTALRLSDEVGCFGILTHPLDDDVRAFYRSYGFVDLPGDAKRSMLLRLSEVRENRS